MPRHVVKQGDCLPSIARRYGFGDWHLLYDHPQNAELKQRRPDPNVLFPGDVVFIPPREEKTVSLATGQTHQIQVTLPQRWLKLTVKDREDQPLADTPFAVEGDDFFRGGRTDGEGALCVKIPANAKAATLSAGGMKWSLALGALNPLEDVDDGGASGAQARLRNLGFDPGRVDGTVDAGTAEALRAFQHRFSLDVTGELDDDTLRKLKEVAGA